MTASSRDVAKAFGKQHRNVVRAIEELDCSQEFKLLNFERLKFNHRGNEYIYYPMTRDGFSFLCMGFTGKQAASWKEKYIAAFNAMEAELLQQKIWIGGLTQALEHICPTPPTEADNIRNQRAVKTLRALAAYWSILEEMPLRAAESAACVVGRLRRLDDLDLTRHQFGDMRDFLERAIIHSDKDMRPATEEQINAIKFLVEACAQFRYSRDRNIYNLLQEEYGISIETIVNATSGEAKRIAALAYNLLHQHLMQTMTINEIKRRAQEADGKRPDSDELPPQIDDGEEQP
ncbi:MAG: Rha family transcriptional regulator [Desulfobulbaceae bacterium]|nr:Rha family transcriptional regulator [Desulfobulbaceae bacterium]